MASKEAYERHERVRRIFGPSTVRSLVENVDEADVLAVSLGKRCGEVATGKEAQ